MLEALKGIYKILKVMVDAVKGFFHILLHPINSIIDFIVWLAHISIPLCAIIATVSVLLYICGSKKAGRIIYWCIMGCIIINALGVALNAIK